MKITCKPAKPVVKKASKPARKRLTMKQFEALVLSTFENDGELEPELDFPLRRAA